MNREEILLEAQKAITGHREQDHVEMENSFETIAGFWTVYLGKEITAKDVAVMMSLLKIARIKTGHDEKDSFIDACGYMACAGELYGGNQESPSKKVFMEEVTKAFSETVF